LKVESKLLQKMETSSIKLFVVFAIAGILVVGAFPQVPSTPQMQGEGMAPGIPSGQGSQGKQ
jgi:hypothetical protein